MQLSREIVIEAGGGIRVMQESCAMPAASLFSCSLVTGYPEITFTSGPFLIRPDRSRDNYQRFLFARDRFAFRVGPYPAVESVWFLSPVRGSIFIVPSACMIGTIA